MSTATTPGPAFGPGGASPAHPTPVAERALAPDLARGMMLLLIALAHVPWFLYTSNLGITIQHPADGGIADRIAQVITIVVVDARTYTMFAFLFAYGIGQLYARRRAGGTSERDVRRLLRTRHLWLLAFGLLHAVLLWQGDILGTYGLMGLLLVPLFLHRSDRALKLWTGGLLAVGALFSVVSTAVAQLGAVAGPAPDMLQQLTASQEGYLATAPLRLATWIPGLPSAFATIVLPVAFLLGLLASRHRVLEEPSRHLRLLRRTAIVGIAIGWGGGVVQAMAHVGALTVPAALGTMHLYTGFFAGIGYAAVFGLVAHRFATRGTTPPLPVRAVLALGRRSLSGYVAQSIVFVPLFSAWGLGVGAGLSSWSAMLVGIGTWLLTVALAYLVDRAGVRGPLETALRRLTYRPVRRRPEATAGG